jgi:hypothetical protein
MSTRSQFLRFGGVAAMLLASACSAETAEDDGAAENTGAFSSSEGTSVEGEFTKDDAKGTVRIEAETGWFSYPKLRLHFSGMGPSEERSFDLTASYVAPGQFRYTTLERCTVDIVVKTQERSKATQISITQTEIGLGCLYGSESVTPELVDGTYSRTSP